MARFQLASLGIGSLQNGEGRKLPNRPITLTGGPLYAAATGATEVVAADMVTDDDGVAPGWLDPASDPGIYTISYAGAPAITFEVGDSTVGGVNINAADYLTDFAPFAGPIQKAIDVANAAGGGTVEVPAGTWTTSTAIEIPNFVSIEGFGYGTAILATGNHYVFSFDPGNRTSVRNLFVGTQSGSAQSSGGGFDLTSAGSWIMLEDIYFGSGLHTSINAMPSTIQNSYVFRKLFWFGTTGHNTGIKVGGGAALVEAVHISDVVGNASTAADMGTWLTVPSNAIHIKVARCHFVKATTGISIGATSEVTNLRFTDCTVDQMSGAGVTLNHVRGCEFKGQEITGSGTSALAGLAIGANAKMVKFLGGTVQSCAGEGVTIASGSLHTLIKGAEIVDNNLGNTAALNGITVAAGAARFRILDCTVANGIVGTGHQKTGILVAAGASNNYAITGNACSANETVDTITDGGTGLAKLINGNLPPVEGLAFAATTTALPAYTDFISISGTTTITSISASWVGRVVTLSFLGILTLTDGSNLKLAGNFVTSADDTITLVSDGTNWREIARSVV